MTVAADAADDNGVAQVEFFVDGASLGVDTDASDGWSVAWDTTTAADGGHTVTATATDSAGQTASHTISVTVSNGGGGATTSMGVFSITWAASRHLDVTVNVRRNSDGSADGLTSGDAVVSGATVTLELVRESDGSPGFTCGSDQCWTFTGNTDSSGNFRGKLLHAPSGSYQARVTGLTHGTYTWDPALDQDNPDTFTK